MSQLTPSAGQYVVVLLAEDVDRNYDAESPQEKNKRSSSSRRTWIEIRQSTRRTRSQSVVLLAEDVDRNFIARGRHPKFTPSSSSRRTWIEIVPVPKTAISISSSSSRRTWIEIVKILWLIDDLEPSSSSRRTWIEISLCVAQIRTKTVVLLAEDVDRNDFDFPIWKPEYKVVLLAEDVDRNSYNQYILLAHLGRPPRGGRG